MGSIDGDNLTVITAAQGTANTIGIAPVDRRKDVALDRRLHLVPIKDIENRLDRVPGVLLDREYAEIPWNDPNRDQQVGLHPQGVE